MALRITSLIHDGHNILLATPLFVLMSVFLYCISPRPTHAAALLDAFLQSNHPEKCARNDKQTDEDKFGFQQFPYLTVEFTNIRPRHQALPELLGSVPGQVNAGLLKEERQEAQVAVQILNTDGGRRVCYQLR